MNVSKVLFWLFIPFAIFSCSQDEPTSETPDSNVEKLFTYLEPDKTGVTFNNVLEEKPERHYANFNPIYDGGGVATGDINNDNLPDLYFTGNEVPNKLYLNKGNFEFEDISASAGIEGGGGWHNGVNMVDINADGLLDIYVCRGGWVKDPKLRKNLLFINKGDQKFEEQAAQFGLADQGFSFQSAFFDFDNDGDLDVYLINHPEKSYLQIPGYLEGRKKGSKFEKDRLYENNGNNTFTDITEKAGMNGTFGFGLSVSTADLDNNGYLDIYVSNDYTEPDYLWMNNGDGTFDEEVKEKMRHISVFSMGVDIADLDHDGLEDVFVTEMLPEDYKRSKTNMASMNPKGFYQMVDNGFHYCYMHNNLHLNLGNGHFSEISQLAGLSKTDWSWATFMTDFDNDGLRDVFVANGYRRDLFDKDANKKMDEFFDEHREKKKQGIPDINDALGFFPSEQLENYIYKNDGDFSFTKMTKGWGLDQPSFSNGASIADLDNDGDLDLVVNNMNQEAFVYQNNAEKNSNNYLRIKLLGTDKNLEGTGAKVTLSYGDNIQFEQLKTNRGYLGTVEPILHFGLGAVSKIDEIKVEWLDGKVSILKDVDANSLVTISQAEAQDWNSKEDSPTPIFTEITNQAFETPHKHQENDFDDFKNQILLPHRQSRLGPFISVADVNGDGLEDFYVGGASKQSGQLYIQNSNGKFEPKEVKVFTQDYPYEDMSSLFFDADGDGDQDLYVVSGGTEFPQGSSFLRDRMYLNDGTGDFSRMSDFPKIPNSGSCVLAEDIDADGDLDLFVGGRTTPDRYPYPTSSHILINNEGKFEFATHIWSKTLMDIGMVTSAIWSDFDQNGTPDLILTGEWMNFRFFKNDGSKLTEVTSEVLSGDYTGWWNRIVEHDIDGDGDLDYIAGNLGLNYKFHASEEKPFHVYCDDFDENGSYDVVLAKYYGKKQVPVRGRECSSQQMPFVAEKFPTFHEFADAGLDDIIGDELNEALHYEAKWFESSLLINENGKFTVAKLPLRAQFSPVQDIVIADFDADGKEDYLLGGNLFNPEVETTRADAGVGLFMKINSDLTFSTSTVNESGFFIPYDVKDMQLIHLGKEKKKAVLVGSNDDILRLFSAR